MTAEQKAYADMTWQELQALRSEAHEQASSQAYSAIDIDAVEAEIARRNATRDSGDPYRAARIPHPATTTQDLKEIGAAAEIFAETTRLIAAQMLRHANNPDQIKQLSAKLDETVVGFRAAMWPED